MTPEQFKSWRQGIGLTQQEAADALGISKGSVDLYERGKRRDDDRPVEIPKTVELACDALTLSIAAKRSNARLLTPEVRRNAQTVMYHLNLGTSVSTGEGEAKWYPTLHASLRDEGSIPAGEPSLMEMLFPYGTDSDLRKIAYKLPQD